MNSNCFLHSSGSVSSSTRSGGKVQISSSSFGNDESAIQTRDSDKPIPFLRRLIDMLQDNEAVISFHPGVRKKNGQQTPGRIVVHDRAKVESDILPRYFNHASFASLRRQLNYFAFTRVGKGKQKGATYCNEKVIELLDILTLKRRVVGSTTVPAVPVVQETKVQGTATNKGAKKETADAKRSSGSISPSTSHAVSVDSRSRSNNIKSGKSANQSVKKKRKTCRKSKRIIESVVPVVHLPKRAKVEEDTCLKTLESNEGSSKNKTIAEINAFSVSVSPPPSDNPMNFGNASEPRITLDLTKPPTSDDTNTLSSFSMLTQERRIHNTKEADVLAGCSALLALGCPSS